MRLLHEFVDDLMIALIDGHISVFVSKSIEIFAKDLLFLEIPLKVYPIK